ncbi:MAG: SAM-dependent methyltransferase [Planctomycetaceae bacterium]
MSEASTHSSTTFEQDFQAFLLEHLPAEDFSVLEFTHSRSKKKKADTLPNSTKAEPRKVIVRPVELRSEPHFQIAIQRGKQEFHENLKLDSAVARILEFWPQPFTQARLRTGTAEYRLKANSSGQVKVRETKSAGSPDNGTLTIPAGHNRKKKYLIPEGIPCAFLTEIGVMSKSGNVHASKTRKFRQVNRFLELVDDVLKNIPGDHLNVIDFGCGKSALTFALHHLLTDIRKREVRIMGLDRDPHVIQKCREIANRLKCSGLTFQQGDIADFETNKEPVDLVVSLHACDTATDDALAKAVLWNSRAILAVPCCQHDLNATMNPHQLRTLTQHGILRERFAALATDALRAETLELCGYRTQVVEFIDLEHTAKNVLIRAIRRNHHHPSSKRIAAYREMKSLLQIDSTPLERALADRFPKALR